LDNIILRDAAIRKTPISGANGRIVHGKTLTLAMWTFTAGSSLPAHSHPHEQVTTVVSGTLKLRIGDTTHTLETGDSAVIPGDVEHEATAVTDTVVADAFHPVREDLQ
jgi:quercetin dioxygenase-like cupin family protein